MRIQIELPWPPSINHYWRKNQRGMYISKRGLEYRQDVHLISAWHQNTFTNNERLHLKIFAYPPDKRKRDIDNILKCLLDSLEKAHVFSNDEQIDILEIIRQPEKLKKVVVEIEPINTSFTKSPYLRSMPPNCS